MSHEVAVSAWAEKSLVIVTGFVPEASWLRKSRILGRFSLTLSVFIGVPWFSWGRGIIWKVSDLGKGKVAGC